MEIFFKFYGCVLSVRDRLIPKNIFKVLKKGFFQNTQIEKNLFCNNTVSCIVSHCSKNQFAKKFSDIKK